MVPFQYTIHIMYTKLDRVHPFLDVQIYIDALQLAAPPWTAQA